MWYIDSKVYNKALTEREHGVDDEDEDSEEIVAGIADISPGVNIQKP